MLVVVMLGIAILLVNVGNFAEAAGKYSVNAVILEEVNGKRMSKAELDAIKEMKSLAKGKAELRDTTMQIEGKVKKLSFSDLGLSESRAKVTVALFPKACGLPEIKYLANGGYFLATDPIAALKLLKKYL